MSAHDDSWPAFPTGRCEGMSLRDYFAAKALSKAMEDYMGSYRVGFDHDQNSDYLKQAAHAAYVVADAMLEARKS